MPLALDVVTVLVTRIGLEEFHESYNVIDMFVLLSVHLSARNDIPLTVSATVAILHVWVA